MQTGSGDGVRPADKTMRGRKIEEKVLLGKNPFPGEQLQCGAAKAAGMRQLTFRNRDSLCHTRPKTSFRLSVAVCEKKSAAFGTGVDSAQIRKNPLPGRR